MVAKKLDEERKNWPKWVGNANLFVIGKDTRGEVQTFLENYGLWNTLMWKSLLHYYDQKVKEITQLEWNKLDEAAFKLRNVDGGEHKTVDSCFCQPFTEFAKRVGQELIVVVSLVDGDPCEPEKHNETCINSLKELKGLRMAVGLMHRNETLTQSFAYLQKHHFRNETNIIYVPAEHPYATYVNPRTDPHKWDDLLTKRTEVERNISALFKVTRKDSVVTCYAKPPELTICGRYGPLSCTELMKVKGSEKPCIKNKYCRPCFAIQTTTKAIDSDGTTNKTENTQKTKGPETTTQKGTQKTRDLSTSTVSPVPFQRENTNSAGTYGPRKIGDLSTSTASSVPLKQGNTDSTDARANLPTWALGVIAASVVFFIVAAAIGLFYILHGAKSEKRETTASAPRQVSSRAPSTTRSSILVPSHSSEAATSAVSFASEDPSVPLGSSLRPADYGITESTLTKYSHPLSREETANQKKDPSQGVESEKKSVDSKEKPVETGKGLDSETHTDSLSYSPASSSSPGASKDNLKKPNRDSESMGNTDSASPIHPKKPMKTVPTVGKETPKLLANASLFVIGEDTEGQVQTLLENYGLWETLNWISLLHYHDQKVKEINLTKQNLEEAVFRLRNVDGGKHATVDGCFCQPFVNFTERVKHELIVVVSLVDGDPCKLEKHTEACITSLKKLEGLRMAVGLMYRGENQTGSFAYLLKRFFSEDTHFVNVPAEDPYATYVNPHDNTQEWGNLMINGYDFVLQTKRAEVERNLSALFNVSRKDSVVICVAKPPDQTPCIGRSESHCTNSWDKIKLEDTRECRKHRYCRRCFDWLPAVLTTTKSDITDSDGITQKETTTVPETPDNQINHSSESSMFTETTTLTEGDSTALGRNGTLQPSGQDRTGTGDFAEASTHGRHEGLTRGTDIAPSTKATSSQRGRRGIATWVIIVIVCIVLLFIVAPVSFCCILGRGQKRKRSPNSRVISNSAPISYRSDDPLSSERSLGLGPSLRPPVTYEDAGSQCSVPLSRLATLPIQHSPLPVPESDKNSLKMQPAANVEPQPPEATTEEKIVLTEEATTSHIDSTQISDSEKKTRDEKMTTIDDDDSVTGDEDSVTEADEQTETTSVVKRQ